MATVVVSDLWTRCVSHEKNDEKRKRKWQEMIVKGDNWPGWFNNRGGQTASLTGGGGPGGKSRANICRCCLSLGQGRAGRGPSSWYRHCQPIK